MLDQNSSIKELLAVIEERMQNNDFKDAVHKIKFITARDMIQELMGK